MYKFFYLTLLSISYMLIAGKNHIGNQASTDSDSYGNTPLMQALIEFYYNEHLQNEYIQHYITTGSDLSLRNSANDTAFTLACYTCNISALKLLLKYKAHFCLSIKELQKTYKKLIASGNPYSAGFPEKSASVKNIIIQAITDLSKRSQVDKPSL